MAVCHYIAHHKQRGTVTKRGRVLAFATARAAVAAARKAVKKYGGEAEVRKTCYVQGERVAHRAVKRCLLEGKKAICKRVAR